MKEINKNELEIISGGAWTAEHGISGGLAGGLGGAGVAAGYIALASNPVGWVAMGIIGGGAAIGALYKMALY
ncbi:class IIb bacteriocin, lactobin A/cerein 7B family [Rheinheimera pleomorphica]|uniref:class IIb bacteriocin, lactobin A/cerein 7B family n=1 Tax=Rheinheimera pleomorphica TaxID=2703963 RepID=UPI00141E0C8D|nr:class IIb bacteriocin, lactobin A/cerein 7B family [Rheinheimera pleomorphica]